MGALEVLIFIGIILLVCLALLCLAGIVRLVLVKIAKRNGYTADEMPMIYHMFAFGIYFSIIFAVIAVGAWT